MRRARRLLGTDTAYMTLHDPERGDTWMRVTDGSVSAKFRTLRPAMGRAGEGASAAELGLVGLLVGGGRDIGAFIGSAIGPVVGYDARRGTALVHTLTTYFGTGASLSRTAEALHIHVDTVTQRLDRVARLLDDGWQAPERALEVRLALRLHRLSG
ncbi:helix-turn-helix domain-containing protein [Streptosporangium sp. NPDC006007]|uniref:helix-turn-helix domain-containing protein n=1 Tax=Streptosporangium sp. NPDC006007 TaxID=3154575 RepID=UPI0033A94D8C